MSSIRGKPADVHNKMGSFMNIGSYIISLVGVYEHRELYYQSCWCL